MNTPDTVSPFLWHALGFWDRHLEVMDLTPLRDLYLGFTTAVEPTWRFLSVNHRDDTKFSKADLAVASVSEDMGLWFDQNGINTRTIVQNDMGRLYCADMTPDQELLFKLRWL